MTGHAVAIMGAAGYGGQELLRLLAGHPAVRVSHVASRRYAGRTVDDVLSPITGFYPDLQFRDPSEPLPPGVEAVFLATPHGASQALFERIDEASPDLAVVDLSGDFRLGDRALAKKVYGVEHSDQERAATFAYGLTEMNRETIRSSRRVANPGCFATGAILALAPLAEGGFLRGDLTLSQTTGSSGSGADPKAGTHHPERMQDMRAYKVFGHQHEHEIVQELSRLGGGGFDLAMIPHSGPFARGIFTAAHLTVEEGVDVEDLYRQRYEGEFFIRVRQGTPALRHVVRTNFCDLAIHRRGNRVVILSAIDNLVKGMAGQAIQNMNLLLGLDEGTGLRLAGGNA